MKLTNLPYYAKRDAYRILHGNEWWSEEHMYEMDKQLEALQRILDKVNRGNEK